MMTESELHWLAGLLEGEGCFTIRHRYAKKGADKRYGQPSVMCKMSDRDVLVTAREITGVGNVNGPYAQGMNGRKPQYMWSVVSKQAVLDLMALVHPLMHSRRQQRIEEIFEICNYDFARQ